jgi:hypothetical protein
MAHDVFISYAQHDKPTADAVCHGLESAGVRCWIAPRDVRAGSNWKTQLVEAIRNARVMVLVFSGEADRSPQVMREVDIAFEAGAPIVPFRIEDVKMSDEMYYCIAARHWLDALNPPLEEHIARLTAAVGAILAVRAPEAGTVIGSASDAGMPVPRAISPQPAQDVPAQQPSRPAAVPPPSQVAAVRDPAPGAVPPGTAGAQAARPEPSRVRGRTVGLIVLVAAVLVAATLKLRGLIGNEDALLVVAIVAGAFFFALGRKRR